MPLIYNGTTIPENVANSFSYNGNDVKEVFFNGTRVYLQSLVFGTQQAKIQSSDVQSGDSFGRSVSISNDGNTAVVGAHLEDAGGSNAGAAYIFTRSGDTWSQQAKLLASDAQASDYFGYSASISGDGNTVIVGAYGEDTTASTSGAAYIFTRSGDTWSQQARVKASDAQANDYFGLTVSISNDGNTAVVSAYWEDTGASEAGAAYIFTRSGDTWSQQAKLLAGDAQAFAYFSRGVSISGDGNTIILGAYGEDTGASDAGAAYIFTRSGDTWSQQAKLLASDAQASDYFGYAASISEDGNTAIVGAYGKDTGASDAGAAYIFTRSGSTWSEQAKIQASDAQSFDNFGRSVSISNDGNTVIVGAYMEDAGGSNAGAAYVFTRSETTWSQQAKLLAGDAQANDYFSWSVSISGDGNTIIVGAYGKDTGASDAGAAYVFV